MCLWLSMDIFIHGFLLPFITSSVIISCTMSLHECSCSRDEWCIFSNIYSGFASTGPTGSLMSYHSLFSYFAGWLVAWQHFSLPGPRFLGQTENKTIHFSYTKQCHRHTPVQKKSIKLYFTFGLNCLLRFLQILFWSCSLWYSQCLCFLLLSPRTLIITASSKHYRETLFVCHLLQIPAPGLKSRKYLLTLPHFSYWIPCILFTLLNSTNFFQDLKNLQQFLTDT